MARRVGRLQTFSVAFEDRACNELAYAREVAASIGAENHEVIVGERDFFGALPRLIWHEDEPIAHASSVPLYFVSELARRHVKVVLTGEGSDELLAGYGRYPRALLNWRLGGVYASTVPGAMRRGLAGLADRLPGKIGRYARRSFLAVEHAPDMAFFDNFAAVNLARQRELLSPRLRDLVQRERAYGSVMAAFDRPSPARPLLDHLLYADLEDVSGRAAHEAGPDEHGRVDREPRAVPRSSPGRVRLAPRARSQTVGIHDQAHPS